MNNLTQDLFTFIEQSPTAFHVAASAARALEDAGFRQLREQDPWDLRPGEKCYVTRNQSSLVAFRVPERLQGFMIGAAHTDSPCLRIKENMELRLQGLTRLDAEKYGGMLMSTWLDRPLGVAGRITVATETGVASRLVNLDRDLMVIPSLAVHMDRSSGDGKKYTVQTDMLPLLGDEGASLLPLAAEAAGVREADILAFDLYAVNRDRGTVLGPRGEYILCPRLDDQLSVFSLLRGFLAAKPREDTMPMLCLFDSEEVGSQTRQGAQSTLLVDTLRRISGGEEAMLRALANSLLISADNAHAVHPAHPEKAAPSSHPRMNGGVVVKFGPRYATDGPSAAIFRRIAGRAGVPLQSFYNHSDIAGGGTLGLLSMCQVSVHTVDLGLSQLAMHSARETAGAEDCGHLIRAMEAVFSSGLACTEPETFTLL